MIRVLYPDRQTEPGGRIGFEVSGVMSQSLQEAGWLGVRPTRVVIARTIGCGMEKVSINPSITLVLNG
jgi:hypothetical protein